MGRTGLYAFTLTLCVEITVSKRLISRMITSTYTGITHILHQAVSKCIDKFSYKVDIIVYVIVERFKGISGPQE